MRTGRIGPMLLVAGLVVGGLAMVAPAAADAPTFKALTGNFAGTVEGSDAYVAVVAAEPEEGKAKREVLAYVCDGAEIAEWFEGTTKKNSFTLTSDDGAKLKVKIGADSANGSFRPDDGEKSTFDAPVAEEPAGLYRAEDTIAGDDYLGGWILLPDGTSRGQVRMNRMPPAPGQVTIPIDFFMPGMAVMVPGGVLTPMFINPTTQTFSDPSPDR